MKYSSPILQRLLKRRDPKQSNRTRGRMLVAARIADIIEAKGWTKDRLAEELGSTSDEVERWLSGTHNFDLDTINDIEYITGEVIMFHYGRRIKK